MSSEGHPVDSEGVALVFKIRRLAACVYYLLSVLPFVFSWASEGSVSQAISKNMWCYNICITVMVMASCSMGSVSAEDH